MDVGSCHDAKAALRLAMTKGCLQAQGQVLIRGCASSLLAHTTRSCSTQVFALCNTALVCLWKSAACRDGAMMHSKRRRKIQRSLQSPVLAPAASPVANRVLLGRAVFLQTPPAKRTRLGDCLLDTAGRRQPRVYWDTYLLCRRAVMAGQPRVSQARSAVAIDPAFAVEEGEQRARSRALS